jgi:uncharacterized cupredoxin-like copper-binding protein
MEHPMSSANPEGPVRPRSDTSRSDNFAIIALSVAVLSLALAAAALVYAVQAHDSAQASKRAAEATAAHVSPNPTSSPTTAAPVVVATVTVAERELTLTPDVSTVPAGRVKFVVNNVGAIKHEVVVMKTDNDLNALPIDAKTSKVVENGQGDKDIGEVNDVGPQSSGSNVITLTPGKYVLLCNVPGHYSGGMRAPFTVS